jgi:hypothetical protein
MGTQTTLTIDGAAVDLSAHANAPRTWALSGGVPFGGVPYTVGIYASPDGGTTYQLVRVLVSGNLTTEDPTFPGTPILGTHVRAVTLNGTNTGAVLVVGTDGSAAAEDALNIPASVGAFGTVTDLNTRGELRTAYITGSGGGAAFQVWVSNDNTNFSLYPMPSPTLDEGFSFVDVSGQYRYVKLFRVAGTGGAVLLVSTPTPAGAAGGGGAPSGPAGGDLGGTYPDPAVEALQGNAVSGSAPNSNQQALVWNTGSHEWTPAPVPSIAGGEVATTDASLNEFVHITSAQLGVGDGTWFVAALVFQYLTGTTATNFQGLASARVTRTAGAVSVTSSFPFSGYSSMPFNSTAFWQSDGAGGLYLVAQGIAATDLTWDAVVAAGGLYRIA